MAKQLINTGTTANDGTGDPLRSAFTKTNSNINEVYNALGNGTSLTNLINNAGEIELAGRPNKISFVYTQLSNLPNAANFQGCIALVTNTGSLYYAHAGAWRKVLTDTSGGAVSGYTDNLSPVAFSGNLLDLGIADGADGQVLTTDGNGNFAFSTVSGGGGGGGGGGENAFSFIEVSGQNTVAADSPTDTLTLVAGSGIEITTNSAADSVTISATSTGGSSTFADLTEAVAAGVSIDDVALAAATNLIVTANGSSAYRFDQYGATDNPTLYVKAGTTIAFNLDAISGHPFLIRSGGSNYDVGLVHVAANGTVSTGSAAQGKTSGTLYWKIPATISGTYGYLCQLHGGMTGNIIVASAGGQVRVTQAVTTASIANGASANISFGNLGLSYALYSIQVDKACWVRIYSDTTSRTADAGRSQGADPSEGAGVVAEVIATGPTTFKVTPAVFGYVSTGEATIPVAVRNNSGSAGTVQVTLTALALEY